MQPPHPLLYPAPVLPPPPKHHTGEVQLPRVPSLVCMQECLGVVRIVRALKFQRNTQNDLAVAIITVQI